MTSVMNANPFQHFKMSFACWPLACYAHAGPTKRGRASPPLGGPPGGGPRCRDSHDSQDKIMSHMTHICALMQHIQSRLGRKYTLSFMQCMVYSNMYHCDARATLIRHHTDSAHLQWS